MASPTLVYRERLVTPHSLTPFWRQKNRVLKHHHAPPLWEVVHLLCGSHEIHESVLGIMMSFLSATSVRVSSFTATTAYHDNSTRIYTDKENILDCEKTMMSNLVRKME